MRYAKIRKMDISNGEGIRVSLFVQGCSFHCKGCFNKETWDFQGGYKWNKEIEDEFINLCKQPHITAVSILGGEPFQQDTELLTLLGRIRFEVGKPVSVWTGYKFEEIPYDKLHWLAYIDEVTDGRFEEDLYDYSLKFKGSTNQKIYRKGIDY